MRSISSERLTGFNVGLGFVGVLLSSWLVLAHLFVEPICPTLVGIPACYLVLVGYLTATIGAWRAETPAGSTLFVIGAGAVAFIGAWFSLNQALGEIDCPDFEGLPMCYVSLLAGVTMLAVDLARRRAR